MTSLPWMSSQARTQRSHRMQASWSTSMTGFDESVPAARSARQLGGLAGDAEAVGQVEQQVVAGGGLLGVLGARRLVGHQQLGQDGAAALQLRAGRRDLHAVLARAHAGGGEDPAAGVDHAHPADPDGVVALVVAQHRDVHADLLGGVEDRGALCDGDLVAVDLGGDGATVRVDAGGSCRHAVMAVDPGHCVVVRRGSAGRPWSRESARARPDPRTRSARPRPSRARRSSRPTMPAAARRVSAAVAARPQRQRGLQHPGGQRVVGGGRRPPAG